ncbi:MAG TPA: inositol monophosphatase family protein [Marmoricola sp.]
MTGAGELLDLAVATAREAAELVVAMRSAGVRVAGTKSSEIDVVTEADRAAEALVRERLLAARPDDGLFGEEGSRVDGTSGVRWIVDPIDGTVNYLYGLPAYAVSLAADVEGTIEVGVVVEAATGRVFSGVRGQGAWCDGAALTCRAMVPESQTLIATGFNYEQHVREGQAAAVARMLPRVRDIRRMGSCALDLCALAAGRIDAYVEEGPEIWDDAAGGLIATEAGARVEVRRGVSGKRLIIAAPAHSFDRFEALTRACDF